MARLEWKFLKKRNEIMMTVKELKIILNTLDDDIEVQVRNHHLEDNPIVQSKMKLVNPTRKDATMVLTLAERRL